MTRRALALEMVLDAVSSDWIFRDARAGPRAEIILDAPEKPPPHAFGVGGHQFRPAGRSLL